MEQLLPNTFVHLAVGLALLLAWRQDPTQDFTRWLALSFLVNATWLGGFALYGSSQTGLKWVGAALWALQQGASTVLLVMGALALRARPINNRQCLWVALLLSAYLFCATLFGVQVASAAAAVPLSLALLATARILLGGDAIERFAAYLLGVNALLLWITPMLGIEKFPLQAQSVAALRLMLGLTLLLACLRKLSQESLLAADQFRRLIDGSHQSVMVIQDGQVVYANPEYLRLFGFASLAEIPALGDDPSMTPEDRIQNKARQELLLGQKVESLNWYQALNRHDGVLLELRMSAWRIEWSHRPAIQVVISDETELKQSTRRLLHDATHDRLTGLPNRSKAHDRFNELRDLGEGTCALLLLNLANFSSVNSSVGYLAGDELLKQVAHRFKALVLPDHLLARVGGDEFLVLVAGPEPETKAQQQAKVLLAAMEEPFVAQRFKLVSSASAGIAVSSGPQDEFDTLLGYATLAAKHARQAGRNALLSFQQSMNQSALEDLDLGHELHAALHHGQLELFYQPIVDARSSHIVGAEALLRWNHPERGSIPPGRFIPVAERLGLIVDIGDWVLNEACRTLAEWSRTPVLSTLTLSINVSTVQCARGGFDVQVSNALASNGAPQDKLELEITESALISEPEQFVELLAKLRAVGVRLAIDDFGTGYSNLSYLQRFKVDKLKVDQSFVRGLATNPQDAAIVRAVIQLADTLGLTTTAEGVEDALSADALVRLGCAQAQGYYFARPMDRGSFEASAERHLASGATPAASNP